MKHEFLGMSKEGSHYNGIEGCNDFVDGWHGQVTTHEYWGVNKEGSHYY